MEFFLNLFGSRSAKVREEATRLGITVAQVEREMPHFSRDMKSVDLKKGSCVRYSLARRGAEPRVTWALLQRTEALGATLPNDYLLNNNGVLPTTLMNELRAVAEDYSEEYFEFEGTSSEVAVYWEEWGGPEKAKSIHGLLTRLALW